MRFHSVPDLGIGVMDTERLPIEELNEYPRSSEISSVVEYVRRHPGERLSVHELADFADLSVRQLHRHFYRELAIGPQQFLMTTRVHAARDALIASDKSIVAISDEFGFYDQSDFTRHFRKYFGFTPAAYRKKFRS